MTPAVCEICDDTGWHEWWCGPTTTSPHPSWLERQWCGRAACRTSGGHHWVGPCACVPSNPVVAAKRRVKRTA